MALVLQGGHISQADNGRGGRVYHNTNTQGNHGHVSWSFPVINSLERDGATKLIAQDTHHML